MHSIPYGTWDRANSNTVLCRQLHTLLTPYRPDVHCPQAGASDDGKDDRMLNRHEIHLLRRAEHTWNEIAALSGVSEKTARRIAAEEPVNSVDSAAERSRRQVGRPSKAEAWWLSHKSP